MVHFSFAIRVSFQMLDSPVDGKCIPFSTHELDVALRMCDSIALVDNGVLHHLSVTGMVYSGHIKIILVSGFEL